MKKSKAKKFGVFIFQIFMKWYDIKPRYINRFKDKKTRSKRLQSIQDCSKKAQRDYQNFAGGSKN